MGSFGTVGETQTPYETGEKMEMAKQDTIKISFLTLSVSKISIVVTGILPKTEGDYDKISAGAPEIENEIILTNWCFCKSPYRKQKTSKKL